MAVVLGVMGVSCSAIYEKTDDCPSGVKVRFIYDHNIKWANAFPNEVGAVRLYIFDSTGVLINSYHETQKEMLANENYRMELNLKAGRYQALAIGGTIDKSFDTTRLRNGISKVEEFQMRLKRSDYDLDGLWWKLENNFRVEGKGEEKTISLIKNTNRIRIVLQHISGKEVNPEDFHFAITDDNTLLDHRNNPVPGNPVNYTPYARGQITIEAEPAVKVAYFELATSRLIHKQNARLVVTRSSDSKKIIDIPLIDYLLLTQMEGYKISAQEYLDRQDAYSMVFFLDEGYSWLRVQIIINNWIIRLNEVEI